MRDYEDGEPCPCGSGKPHGACCGALLSGARAAATAEELMRARYSAYATGKIEFLRESCGPEAAAEFDEGNTRAWAQNSVWHGLEIRATDKGGPDDDEGTVSFTAFYDVNGKSCTHRETAFFRRLGGAWKFIDGTMEKEVPFRREAPKVNRNDPCPCGSGKKFKKCCGK